MLATALVYTLPDGRVCLVVDTLAPEVALTDLATLRGMSVDYRPRIVTIEWRELEPDPPAGGAGKQARG